MSSIFSLGTSPNVSMLDIVELDPKRDTNGITTRVAVSVVLTFFGGLVLRSRSSGEKRPW